MKAAGSFREGGLQPTPEISVIVIGEQISCLPNTARSHAAPLNFSMIG